MQPTRMTPAKYVDEIVIPTVREFRDNPRSRRHAYLACMVTFHIKDYLERAGEKQITNKMQAGGSKSFNLVRSICNGTKHGGPDRSDPIQFQPGSDYYRPSGRAGEMEAGVSEVGDPIGGRQIESGAGRFDLYRACKDTLTNFQRQFPGHLGACDLSDC
jgi:hypothetical protein